jgi:hypothetical protein
MNEIVTYLIYYGVLSVVGKKADESDEAFAKYLAMKQRKDNDSAA